MIIWAYIKELWRSQNEQKILAEEEKKCDVKKALPYFTFCNSKLAYIFISFFFVCRQDTILNQTNKPKEKKKRAFRFWKFTFCVQLDVLLYLGEEVLHLDT